MIVNGIHRRTIWIREDGMVGIIDQNRLPFEFCEMTLTSVEDAADAIRDMHVRGAGLIGATAACGMYLAVRDCLRKASTNYDACLETAAKLLIATRPTASNLAWAVGIMQRRIRATEPAEVEHIALTVAQEIADFDADACRCIGTNGVALIEEIARSKRDEPVQILTHCNAGWLAFVDYGSATAPIYLAHDRGIPVHVWVDETRPRNQGARLTAWELGMHGVPHTLIPDNAGGHLMQHGLVDLVIVGTDRVTRRGDVCNKIGTYLKALAANDNDVPFYVALPTSTIDLEIDDGLESVPIEERNADEVRFMSGIDACGNEKTVQICPDTTPAANYGFDVTPARLVTRLITEEGICEAETGAIERLLSTTNKRRPT